MGSPGRTRFAREPGKPSCIPSSRFRASKLVREPDKNGGRTRFRMRAGQQDVAGHDSMFEFRELAAREGSLLVGGSRTTSVRTYVRVYEHCSWVADRAPRPVSKQARWMSG